MKKTRILILSLLAVAIFSLPAFAQKATRVNFKKGTHSAIITGTLNNYAGKRVFLVRVHDGQTLKVETIKNAVSVWIEGPPGSVEQDLAADCHGNSEITPTTKGDYKLTVQECSKADAWKGTFKVRVTVN
jgi:hypothetical protein